MKHTLKTDPAVFQSVVEGAKTYEIRLDDRGYAVGDELHLRETTRTGAEIAAGAALEYTGREITRSVSHVLRGYGLADGWVILSFAPARQTNMSPEAMMPALQSMFAEIFHSPAGDPQLDVFRDRFVAALTDYVGATLAAHSKDKRYFRDEYYLTCGGPLRPA